ncbi:MAG: YihY family inner membrane protein [Chromatiales bacterium]|jgi:membrane protein
MTTIAGDLWNHTRKLLTQFFEHRGLTNAASLTYSTLLSLVPMLTVVFAVLSAFPLADQMAQMLQDFIFRHFVPAAGQAVQSHIEDFIARASQLSGLSFLFLIIIALLLMQNIDNALNGIWQTRQRRRPAQKFLVYWALISLGPLLLAISIALTSYMVTIPLLAEARESLHLGNRALLIAPVVVSMTAFSLMYLIIPNHRVPVRYALAGGLFAAVLFDLANRAFGFYVTSLASYQAIYGALAVIPIFLVWIYLSWVIFLLGAEFTACLEQCRTAFRPGQAGELETAFMILAAMRELQQSGDFMQENQLMRMASGLPELPQKMSRTGLILRTERESWIPSGDLHDLTLLDLYRRLDVPLPASVSDAPELAGLARHLEAANRKIEQILSVSVARLHEEGGAEGGERKEKAGD